MNVQVRSNFKAELLIAIGIWKAKIYARWESMLTFKSKRRYIFRETLLILVRNNDKENVFTLEKTAVDCPKGGLIPMQNRG